MASALYLDQMLRESAARHRHLCPRQVLGVRMGLLAGNLLELALPQANKRLFAFVETDGCFADGVSVATGCWFGRRTMRLVDFGKVAATFVDLRDDQAFRITPAPDVRSRAVAYAPDAPSRWHTYLEAYQAMPDAELLIAQPVTLTVDLVALISRAGARVTCMRCGEEILNERQVVGKDEVICRGCAGEQYYQSLA